MKTEPSLSDQEMISTRVIDFPVGSVWSAWADPALLAEWWGPDGFTNTFGEFDFAVDCNEQNFNRLQVVLENKI